LERQDWKGAAQLQPLGTPSPAAEAITHFARAIGAARSGDAAAAQADIDKLKQLREGLLAGRQPYWAEQVEIQVLAATAWLHNSQGNRDEALKFMRGAADLEDSSEKHVAMENRLYPMRELLGDMLRGYGEPAAALKEYARGRQAIEAKDWRGAVRLLSSAALRDTRNADIQNYLGYAYRNLGEMPLAFKHYSRALQLDPRHRGAHEYLGEAYLMIGNLAKAEEHLGALKKICLLPCAEYGILESKVAEFRKRAAR